MKKTIFFLFLFISLSILPAYATSKITVSHTVTNCETLQTGTHTFVLSGNNEKIEKTIVSNSTCIFDVGPGSYTLTREPANYNNLIPDMSVYYITITDNGTEIIKKDGVANKQTKIEYVDKYKTTPTNPTKQTTTPTEKTSQKAKTGDNAEFILWIVLLAASISALIYRAIKRRY